MSSLRKNLLALPALRRLVRSPWLPLSFQILMLLAMGFLAWIGGTTSVPGSEKEVLILRKTNLTTLAIWGLWWPCMILGALLAGRLWCAVCPMELVNRIGNALGRRMGSARFRLGPFLRAGWLILFLYVVLQFLVAGLALHRMPPYTAWMLGAMLLLAYGAGLVIREERSFCKAFCPAQALLSVYGRFTPLQLDKVDASTCEACTTKECVQPGLRDRFEARSCPSSLRPFDRTASDGCVLCLQCVKVCPKANIGWGWRSHPDTGPMERLKPYEAGFVMIAIGFVAHELFGEVQGFETLFHAVPRWLNHLAPQVAFGWLEAFWFLLLFPLGFWSLATLLTRALDNRPSPKAILLAAATGAAPIVALAHAGKAMAKLGAWSGFLPLALREPTGIQTMQHILSDQMKAPSALYGVPAVGWAMALAPCWLAFRTFRGLAPSQEQNYRSAFLTGQIGAACLFLIAAIGWIRL